MLICSVCRSQNMESAKFCGNCGNPFPRPADSTSSLINCAQGHVYSAVYQHCPYCPQPSTDASSDLAASDFVTRVEDLSTSIDEPEYPTGVGLPVPPAPSLSPVSTVAGQNLNNDFVTRVGAVETLFETQESLPASPPEPVHAPTEVMTSIPALEIVNRAEAEPPPTRISPVGISDPDTPPALGTVFEAPAPAVGAPAPFQAVSSPRSEQQELDRRTIVVAEQSAAAQGTRGKLVGWLITYNRNPDGDDFRIYDGYNRLGANQVCDIVVEDETVSGSHAIIVYREGRCLIKDDLSRNGTFVNGREITEAYPLQNYDQIRVGNTHLTYVAAQRPS